MYLLVALLLHPEGARGKVALFVRHQVPARSEGDSVKIDHGAADARARTIWNSGEHVSCHRARRLFRLAHTREVCRFPPHARLKLLSLGIDLVRLAA
eukprot:scaffold259919_cov31-Tisochrysis_lutea.AAC.2